MRQRLKIDTTGDGWWSVGLSAEFADAGHDAESFDCKACPPGYPRRCACGGSVHALTRAGSHGAPRAGEARCCDECGVAYREVDFAETLDDIALEVAPCVEVSHARHGVGASRRATARS
jgi:hypothetical protein